MNPTQLIILDYGSQYTQLLSRRIRELGVYSEVVSFKITAKAIKETFSNLKGIILSGGPASVYEHDAYTVDPEIFDLNIPVLGVCYGLQLLCELFGGKVEQATNKEFGKAVLHLDDANSQLFADIKDQSLVWMSHADHITKLPPNFQQIAHSQASIAAIKHQEKPFYGIQFHAEVTHSEQGGTMLKNFLFLVCQAQPDWNMQDFIVKKVAEIKKVVGADQVILGLSGGVDSSVAAALIAKAIGKQLTCIFVDTGLLRKNEANQVMTKYQELFTMNIKLVDAKEKFFKALSGVAEPEAKRKIIGKNFVDIFNDEAKKMQKAKFLAQGTIYPDVIESSAHGHSSKTIKSHHNVGGLPKELKFELLEPLRNLFKDEVREVGRQLGLDNTIVDRHPFPGPGLGVRVIGEVTAEKVKILQEVDDIFISKLYEANLYQTVSQAFATILPVKTVGVMGDNRTYDYVVALRSVNTIDFMTATATHLPWDFLEAVVNEIINKVDGVNRVVYDITSKPPGTIEWE
ncbi:GMP synthase [Spiroplasma clarkii]|uniref:GMP synthase [glutamine-hydrolyzing] n=1 Tax=Spiroplasma clarkii TaxID=2139 RepID=A0A1Y0KZI7_9MOLU|nr:glutamine-hydrolyzing GMP synthase [Spiroplasma clarkii]ARU91143.1 GMP synthase [Spiroplasma clarkii]ATX70586.1 GMP synthase [Spiroplasma clarkii]